MMHKLFLSLILSTILTSLCTPISAEEAILTTNYSIEIISPQPEETFQNSTQSITVQVSIKPEFTPEDTVVVYVDGSAATEPTHATSIALPWLERGSHTLQVKLVSSKGNSAESDIITIYQHRTSQLLPH